MGTKNRKRPRDLPHPTSGDRRRDNFGSAGGGDRAWLPGKGPNVTRVPGTNGSWPAHAVSEGVPPKAPPICLFYDDFHEGLEPAPVFGQYPQGFITKLLPWMECDRHRILHLCSGSLPKGEGIRVDIRASQHPDVVADARQLPRDLFPDGSVDGAMIDPPYTDDYARDLYGLDDAPKPAHLLREAARVVRPGGVIAFVHYLVPMPPDGASFLRAWGLSTGFGFPMRAVTLWRRDQASLPLPGLETPEMVERRGRAEMPRSLRRSLARRAKRRAD